MPVRTWGNADGNWQSSLAWLESLVPTSADDVSILNNNVTNATPASAASLEIRNAATLSTSGNLTVGGFLRIGGGTNLATAILNVTGGTTTANSLIIGDGFNGFSGIPSGRMNVSGAGVVNAGALTVGSGGAGQLVVFNGGTVTSGSTIQVGNGAFNGSITIGGGGFTAAAAGTLNGNIQFNTTGSTLTFFTTDTATYSGTVSGTGSIRQDSAGQTAILTGNNTNTGATFIFNGTLQIGNGGTTGSLGTGAVISSGTLSINRPNLDITNAISGPGNVVIQSGNTVFTGANSYSGTTSITTGAFLQINSSIGSGNILNDGHLYFNSTSNHVLNGIISGNGLLIVSGSVTLTNDSNFSGQTNIDFLTLNIGNGGSTGSLGAGAIVNNSALHFNRNGSFYTVANAISGTGNVQFSGSAFASLTGANSYSGTTTVNSGAILRVESNIGAGNVINNGEIDFVKPGSSAVASVISGTGNVVVGTGAATSLTMTGSNTYSGVTIVGANAVLHIGDGGTTGSLGSGAVINNGNLNFNRMGDGYAIANAISGVGNVSFGGLAGSISISGANSYSGLTIIAASATIQVFSNLGSGNIINAGSLTISKVGASTIASAISGTGELAITSGANLTLTGANSYSGATSIGVNATLNIGNGGATGSLGTGAVANNGLLHFDRSGASYDINNAVGGTGNLQISGNGPAFLRQNNTYSGTTTIDSGSSLQVGAGGTVGALGTGSIINNGTLTFRHSSGTYLIGNAISGSGHLSVQTGGRTVFSGSLTYSGNTQISGPATLALSGDSSLPISSFVNMFGSAILDISQISGPSTTIGPLVNFAATSQIILGGKTLIFTAQDVSLGSGAYVGSAGTDSIVVNQFNLGSSLSIVAALFNNWGPGDTITINGNSLDNTLTGDDIHATIINGGDGNDEIRGGSGNDTLSGDAGFDGLYGGGGNDTLNGGADNDILGGGAGADAIDGGSGNDTVDYSGSASGVTINLATGTFSGGDAAGDTLISIENIRGSFHADILTGDSNGNELYGLDGADQLFGGGGNDFISADVTDTVLDGGTGIDSLSYFDSGTVVATIIGFEALQLNSGAAIILTGTQFANGFALNTAVSGTGSITVNMDAGVFFLSKLFSFAGSGVSMVVNGTAGTDILKLGNVAHTVNAGDGIDQIKGGSAADTINGGSGGDKINGAGGADILTGGAGNDVFKYANVSDSGLGAAADRITDYTIGQDRLNFSRIDTNPALAGDQAFTFLGTAAFAATGLGQLRYLTSGADLIVQADVNGDGVADMEVILQGIGGQVLSGADFVL
jgi:Ca2+-binding RTX toxin-like protein